MTTTKSTCCGGGSEMTNGQRVPYVMLNQNVEIKAKNSYMTCHVTLLTCHVTTTVCIYTQCHLTCHVSKRVLR